MPTPLDTPGYRYSVNTFPGDGATTRFNLSFEGVAPGYLLRSHIRATLRNDETGVETPVPLTDASFVLPARIRVTPAPPVGSTLVVRRETPANSPLVDFSDGALLAEENLDTQARQAVYLAAEAQDRAAETQVILLETQTLATQAAEDAASAASQVAESAADAAAALTTATAAQGLATTAAAAASQAAEDASAAAEAAGGLSDSINQAVMLATAADANATEAITLASGLDDQISTAVMDASEARTIAQQALDEVREVGADQVARDAAAAAQATADTAGNTADTAILLGNNAVTLATVAQERADDAYTLAETKGDGDMKAANNLSDVPNKVTAVQNLGFAQSGLAGTEPANYDVDSQNVRPGSMLKGTRAVVWGTVANKAARSWPAVSEALTVDCSGEGSTLRTFIAVGLESGKVWTSGLSGTSFSGWQEAGGGDGGGGFGSVVFGNSILLGSTGYSGDVASYYMRSEYTDAFHVNLQGTGTVTVRVRRILQSSASVQTWRILNSAAQLIAGPLQVPASTTDFLTMDVAVPPDGIMYVQHANPGATTNLRVSRRTCDVLVDSITGRVPCSVSAMVPW